MSEFREAFDHETRGLKHLSAGALPGCDECGLEDADEEDHERIDRADEGSFSYSACDTCGTTFGGQRHPAHAVRGDNGETIHLDVCVDCLFFIAYREEPEGEWRQHPR